VPDPEQSARQAGMTLVRIAVDQEAPGQDLLSRPGRMVLLRIAPQRGGTRVRRYVLWLGQVESQARHEAGDPPPPPHRETAGMPPVGVSASDRPALPADHLAQYAS
jgi:hypothetical protein